MPAIRRCRATWSGPAVVGSRPQAAAPGDRAARHRTSRLAQHGPPKASLGRCPQRGIADQSGLWPHARIRRTRRPPRRTSGCMLKSGPPAHATHGLSPRRWQDTLHPIPHGTAKRHLTAAGADRLCLQVQQDHPGTGTIGHTKKLGLAAVHQATRFDQQSDPVSLFSQGKSSASFLCGKAVRQKPV